MTTSTTSPDTHAPSRLVRVLTWLLRIALAAIFLGAGLGKLGGQAPMVEMFDIIGVGQWLRYAVGLCEVAGAVGLLVPRLWPLAALGLALLMIGATVTNLAVLHTTPAPTLTILVLAVLALWLGRGWAALRPGARRPQVG
jgi:uncharacterized membrane protein YphA (DoxX/SURF4 family)